MSLSLVLLFAVATTVVWAEGTIFAKIRDRGPRIWQELAGCPLCSGCWIGFLWAAWARRHELAAAPLEFGPWVFGAGVTTGFLALAMKMFWDLQEAAEKACKAHAERVAKNPE